MAGRKRKLDEWDVSEIEESAGVFVYGVVTKIFPVKGALHRFHVRTPCHVII